MPTFHLNKLIRDKLHDEYEKMSQAAVYRELSKEEFLSELKRKIIEEASEIDINDKASVLNELADIQQAIDDLVRAIGATAGEVMAVKSKKFSKKGGFADARYVETLTLQDGDTWTDYYRQDPERFPEEK